MRKRKGNSIAESGLWNAYEYQVVRSKISKQGDDLLIESPSALVSMFRDFADREMNESLFVVSLGGRNNLLGLHRLYTGTATGTSVAIGEIFRSAILMGAVGFAVLHNHPTGLADPSDEDIKLTEEIEKAARILDLQFLDHVVIGTEGRYSSIRSAKPSIWNRSN